MQPHYLSLEPQALQELCCQGAVLVAQVVAARQSTVRALLWLQGKAEVVYTEWV